MTRHPDPLGDLLRDMGPLPERAPEVLRGSLEGLMLRAPCPDASSAGWLRPAALGLAAGVLVSLWIWQPWADAGKTWKKVRFSDGAVMDVAPGSRFEVVGSRPGTVARLDDGTAYFSVPEGQGRFSVSVPGGAVEVVGTRFGVTVRNPGSIHAEGGGAMTKPWMIGTASAVVAVGVTSGVVRYVAAEGEPREVRAGQQLEVGPTGESRLSSVREAEVRRPQNDTPKRPEAPKGLGRTLEVSGKAESGDIWVSAEDLRRLMSDPSIGTQIRAAMGPLLAQGYGGLLDSWNLSPEARKDVEEALADRQLTFAETSKRVPDLSVPVAEVLRVQDEALDRNREALLKRLSQDQVAALERHERERSGRFEMQVIHQQVASLGLPAEKALQVGTVLLEELRNAAMIAGLPGWHAIGDSPVTASEVQQARDAIQGRTPPPDEGAILRAVEAFKSQCGTRLQGVLTPEEIRSLEGRLDAMVRSREVRTEGSGK